MNPAVQNAARVQSGLILILSGQENCKSCPDSRDTDLALLGDSIEQVQMAERGFF